MIDTKKNLNRLPKQGQVAGVCAGLADYFEIDVTLMRVIWVISIFFTSGATIVLYIILALVMPISNEHITIKSKGAKAAENTESFGEKMQSFGKDIQSNVSGGRARNIVGLCLLLFGLWLLLIQFFPEWASINWGMIWPAILVFVGILIIFKRK